MQVRGNPGESRVCDSSMKNEVFFAILNERAHLLKDFNKRDSEKLLTVD